MNLETSLLKIINNLNLNKTKSKWEIISTLSQLYVETAYHIRFNSITNEMTGTNKSSIEPYEKYKTEILELIKILVNSPT
jgi:hypothetical protein